MQCSLFLSIRMTYVCTYVNMVQAVTVTRYNK